MTLTHILKKQLIKKTHTHTHKKHIKNEREGVCPKITLQTYLEKKTKTKIKITLQTDSHTVIRIPTQRRN